VFISAEQSYAEAALQEQDQDALMNSARDPMYDSVPAAYDSVPATYDTVPPEQRGSMAGTIRNQQCLSSSLVLLLLFEIFDYFILFVDTPAPVAPLRNSCKFFSFSFTTIFTNNLSRKKMIPES
jgi:hypothetical protein